MRKIHIFGEINEEAFVIFNRKLDKLESMSNEDIRITLISGGGEASTALAFFDRIKASPCEIDIVATGLVASAASLILAAGDVRYMTKNSWVMVHEDAPGVSKHSNVSQAELQVAHARRLENQWNELLESVTKTSAVAWDKLNKAETYLSAEECLNLGIVDVLI